MKFSKKINQALRNLVLAFSEVSTDKGVISWDSEEDIKEGDEVSVVAEDGSKAKAEDGDYTCEDGTIISVVDGKVSSIAKPEPEEKPAEEVSAEEEPKSEEGTPEEPKEEVKDENPEPAEEPKDDPNSEILDAIKALEDKIAALEERIAKIEEAPAAEPVAEEFSKAVKSANTKDSHYEFLKRLNGGK